MKIIKLALLISSIIVCTSLHAKTTITFDAWMWSEPNFKPMVEAVVAEFEKENPDIKVEMRGGGWAQTRQKLMMRAAAGDAEDVMMLDADWFYFLGSAGVLQDLNEIASKAFLADLSQGALKALVVDGEQVAVPSALTPWGVWTNHELMKKYNLKKNETWDDIFDNCQTLKKAGSKAQIFSPYGMQQAAPLEFVLYFYWNWGVNPMSADHIAKKETGFNVPGFANMLGWLRKMSKNGCLVNYGGDGRNALSHYEAVLHPDGPYLVGIARNSNPDKLAGNKLFDVFSVESPPVLRRGDTPRIQGLGHAMAISAQSEHQKEAMRFVEYWVSNDKGIDLYTTPMGAITPSIKGQNKRKSNDYNNAVSKGYLNKVLPYLQSVPLSEGWTNCGKIAVDAQHRAILTDDPIDDMIKMVDNTCKIILGL